ncbi:MAG: peptide chain release factor N(5)-glutamine methyltransferase [Candidatus Dasytiphilus stammeri]
MNIKSWLNFAKSMLINVSTTPKYDVEVLLEFVTGQSLTWLKTFEDVYILNQSEAEKFKSVLKRRRNGEPIAYIIEKQEFWSLPLSVSPISFIPRADTEILVSEAILHIKKNLTISVLDLGTGTGAISLAIAVERPNCFILGVDNNKDTLLLAQQNAKKLNIQNVSFIYSNWFSELYDHNFHVIVSNPPYIDALDKHLQHGDLRFEPKNALISKERGFFDLKTIISNAAKYLKPSGWLLVEHGWLQGQDVRNLMRKNQFQKILTYFDYGKNERVTKGQKKD